LQNGLYKEMPSGMTFSVKWIKIKKIIKIINKNYNFFIL
jgi:hypothetical protein